MKYYMPCKAMNVVEEFLFMRRKVAAVLAAVLVFESVLCAPIKAFAHEGGSVDGVEIAA